MAWHHKVAAQTSLVSALVVLALPSPASVLTVASVLQDRPASPWSSAGRGRGAALALVNINILIPGLPGSQKTRV